MSEENKQNNTNTPAPPEKNILLPVSGSFAAMF